MSERRGIEAPELAGYEVGVYNRLVREALAEGRNHRHLSDSWADVHWHEIMARDEADARTRITSRYPERAGYVVTEVVRTGD